MSHFSSIFFFGIFCIGAVAQAQDSSARAEGKRPLTVSASLREEYDDNIYTASSHKTEQFKTIVEPSLLFNYPIDQTLLSARYTFGATYFPDRPSSNVDLSHEFLGRVSHSFSDRFKLDVRDRFRLAQEPDIIDGTTLNRVAGDYYNNTFTAQGTAKWLPKLETISTFTDDAYLYRDDNQSRDQDRVTNTFAHDFRYTLIPTMTLVVGGIYNHTDYFHQTFVDPAQTVQRSRSWQSITGLTGVDYAILPNVTLSPRIGFTYNSPEDGSAYTTPYAVLAVDWQVGERSSLNFTYTHSAIQTDIVSYSSQQSDNFAATGRYAITPRLTTRLGLFYNLGDNTGEAALNGSNRSFQENTFGSDWGLSYEWKKNINFDFGYIYAEVESDDPNRQYDRNRIYLGVRATY